MLFELLKNASRAVVETHYEKSELPPIIIRAVEQLTMGTITFKVLSFFFLSPENYRRLYREGFFQTSDLLHFRYYALQISDQGGGIFQDKIEKIWRYGFTTVSDNLVDLSCATTSPTFAMDGLGGRFEYNLPL